MPEPIRIKSWLSIEQMFQWLQNAPNEVSYKKRMAIWLTYTGKLSAPKVAEIVGASSQAVWLWIRQYNSVGPIGLDRKGRGGRRWAFMTPEAETEILKPFIKKAAAGHPPKIAHIKQVIEQKLQKKVSLPYIYRLLNRHHWQDIIAQSKAVSRPSSSHDNLEKLLKPWLREF